MQVQKFGGSEPFVKAEIFRQESYFPANRDVARGRAEHKCLAARGLGQAEQHLDRRALARAVRAEKSENFAALYGQGEVPYRDLAAKNFAQILCPDREVIG